MQRLILFRHAKTEQDSNSGADFDRALTDRGRRDAALMGRVLSGAGLIPAQVLLSAATRCQQTWSEAAPFLPDARIDVREDLYVAGAEDLHAAAIAAEARTVMILAHNPSLQELAETLLRKCTLVEAGVQARFAEGFPPGAAAAFEFEGDRTACLGLFRPIDHGGGR